MTGKSTTFAITTTAASLIAASAIAAAIAFQTTSASAYCLAGDREACLQAAERQIQTDRPTQRWNRSYRHFDDGLAHWVSAPTGGFGY